jgi:hypothetical protein
MRFVDTYRFSPVTQGYDLPWENDLFHKAPEEVPLNIKDYKSFVMDENIIIDEEWWRKQQNRCLNGFTVENAIEPGGDAIVDEEDAFWNDHPTSERVIQWAGHNHIIPPNSCYIPNYDLLIQDNNVNMSNRMYWYLNFWKIYRLDYERRVKDIMPARFTDLDFLFFRRIEMMGEQSKDQSESKSRQKGVSEKIGGGIVGWNYHFVPSSINVIAGGMSDDAEHTMDNFARGARDLINTQFYKLRSRSASDHFKSKYFGSEVMSISCKDNAQALSRFSPYWVIYEEIGKWKKGLIMDAKGFVNASLVAENQKTGYATYIGTGGDMDEGAADLEEIHYNPKNHNTLAFVNKWDRDNSEVTQVGHFIRDLMFKVIDDDGNSLIQESNIVWEREFADLTGKDKYNYTTQHARYASDAFLIQSGGYFGEEIAGWCNERISWIRTHRQAQSVERGFLRWYNNRNWHEGCFWEPDENGPFMISEHPEYDKDGKPFQNLYKIGTDSYDQDEAFTSSSQGACMVKKGFLNAERTYNKYVAVLVERPSVSEGGREKFYEHTALMTIYYGGRNLIEHSNLLIFEWYDRRGLNGWLKEKPEFVMAKMVNKTATSNVYGIDPSTKPHWLRIQADWLRNKENIDKCDFIELLQAWAKFKYRPGVTRYNCDITIATSLCSVLENDESQYEVMSIANEREKIARLPSYQTVNGELVMTLN